MNKSKKIKISKRILYNLTVGEMSQRFRETDEHYIKNKRRIKKSINRMNRDLIIIF